MPAQLGTRGGPSQVRRGLEEASPTRVLAWAARRACGDQAWGVSSHVRTSRALVEDGGALGPCGLLAGASGQLLSVPATAGTVLADTQGPEQGRVRAPDLSSSWVGATFRGPTGARHSCDGARSGSWDSPHSPSRPSVPRGPPEEGHPGEGPQEVGGSHFASSRSGFCGSEEGRALPGVAAFRGRCGGGVRCVALGQRGGRAGSGWRSRAAVVAAGSPLAWTPRSEGRP